MTTQIKIMDRDEAVARAKDTSETESADQVATNVDEGTESAVILELHEQIKAAVLRIARTEAELAVLTHDAIRQTLSGTT